MKTKTLTIILIFITTLGCKNETVSTVDNLELILNNGEKWIANEETHIGMHRMDSILKNNTTSDGKLLGDALSKETNYIIKSCDMKGESHDQLHVVLVPILEEITEIKDVKNAFELELKITMLKNLIATYFEYFKI